MTFASLSDIQHVSSHVGWIGERVHDAHRVGIHHGDADEPFTTEFHRAAARVVVDTLPSNHLRSLSAYYASVAERMSIETAESPLETEWDTITKYLRGASNGFVELLGNHHGAHSEAQIELNHLTLLPIHELARLISPAGATALMRAGVAVAAQVRSRLSCPLDHEELQWIQHLARGHRVLDVAISTGHSERTLYRRLDQIWRKLGVRTRYEGIALVIRNSWI